MATQTFRTLILALTFVATNYGCGDSDQSRSRANNSPAPNASSAPASSGNSSDAAAAAVVPVSGYEVVNTFQHDKGAYTQGLIFHDGHLLESTGREGFSSLRRVELKTGKVLKKVDVPAQYFGEGMTLLNGKIYQLTWQNEKGFIYDPESFKTLGQFAYDGEGWGLTHDGASLILSDGTDEIRFLDPQTFEIKRAIKVAERGRPVREINELEYVKGEIYANVWKTDRLARIDPASGKVLGWIDLKGLIKPSELGDDTDSVLNGIAYDSAGDRLFVTGKLWPKLFEIRLKK